MHARRSVIAKAEQDSSPSTRDFDESQLFENHSRVVSPTNAGAINVSDFSSPKEQLVWFCGLERRDEIHVSVGAIPCGCPNHDDDSGGGKPRPYSLVSSIKFTKISEKTNLLLHLLLRKEETMRASSSPYEGEESGVVSCLLTNAQSLRDPGGFVVRLS